MNEFNLIDAWDAARARLQSDNCPYGLIDLCNDGHITREEVYSEIWQYCPDNDIRVIVARRMMGHSDQWVRIIGTSILEMLEYIENLVTDIKVIEKTSPLQPGVRLRLDGGYNGSYSWWLDGKKCYLATFIRFVERASGEMPAAFVELDDEIDMTEGSGRRHHGKYALIRLRLYAEWKETETIVVHIVEQLPDDIVEFYKTLPKYSEFETHATYRIETQDDT